MSGFNPLRAFLMTFDTYFIGAFTGEGNAAVLLFTFLLGGTIGLVQRSGGALALANTLKGFMGESLLGLIVIDLIVNFSMVNILFLSYYCVTSVPGVVC